MNSKIPVSIVPRDESKKPEWYDQWILDSKSNPNYSGAQVESSESIESMSLVQDPLVGNSKHSVMGPAQFGWVWKDNNQKFMKWYDLWAICRDTQSNQKGEKIVIDAITRFGEQGGRDIWGNSFDSSFESTTTIEAPVETDKMLKHPSGTEYMGNQRYRHPNGEHRRSLENGRPRRPTLRHILVGNGYGLIHLLVAKNMPLSLEHLLSQKIVTIDPIQDDDEDEEEEEEEEDDDDSNDDKDKTDKYINEADETREITKKKKKKKEKKAKESVEKLGDGKTNLSGCTSPSDTFASPTNRKTTKERTCTSKLVNVDLVSWGHETALDLARDLRYVQCALVLEKAGAHLDPGPPVSWLDVWRAIADKIDDVAVETVQKFRRQGCKDVDGFDLSYHRMSRPERGDPQYQFLLKQHRIKDEYATRGDDENDKDGDEDKDGDADEDNVDASRLNHGLRGHQWWGYADETLGWTLAHIAAARDKPLCLSELACAGIDLNANATPGLKRDRCTPLSLAIDKGSTRCVSVLINHGVQPVAGGYGVPGGGLQPMSSQHHISSSSQNNNNNGRRRGVGLYNGNDKHCNSSQGQSHNPWFGFRNQAIEPTSILANETSWVKPYPLNIKQEHDETHNENNSINNSSRSNRRSKTQSDNDNIKLINNLARTLREKTNINHKNSKTEADVSDVFDEMWSKSTPRDYQTSQEVRSFEKNSNNNHNNHNNNNNSNNSVDNNELDENMARTSSGWGNNNEHSGWLEDRETHGWETTETKNGDNHDDGIDDGDGGWGDFNQSNDSSKFNQDQNTCIEEKKEVFNSTKDKYINYRKSAICPLDADQVITYEDMWSALASEPEDQAFHKLKLFLLQSFQNTNQAHQKKKHINDKFVIDNNDDSKHNRNDDSDDAVIDESIETCLGLQRLDNYGERSGYTMAHLCAEKQYWHCLQLVLEKMSPKHRHLRDVSGYTAIELARERRILSVRCSTLNKTTAKSLDQFESILIKYSKECSKENKDILWQKVYDAIQNTSDNEASEVLQKFISQGCVDRNGHGIEHRLSSVKNETLMTIALKRRSMIKTIALLHQVIKKNRQIKKTEQQSLYRSSCRTTLQNKTVINSKENKISTLKQSSNKEKNSFTDIGELQLRTEESWIDTRRNEKNSKSKETLLSKTRKAQLNTSSFTLG